MVATTKLIRRRFYAATAAASAIAAVMAVTPLLAGDPDAPDGVAAFLNQVEGGVHDRAHGPASAAAKAAARAAARACLTAPEGTPECPEDPATPAQLVAATRAAATLDPAESTKPDGVWGPLLQVPTTAIHAIVLPTNKVLFLSQPKEPAEDELEGGNAHLWDPATNTFTAVPPPVVEWPTGPDRPANIWCGGHVQLADGRVLVVGGNLAYPADAGEGLGMGAGNGFKGAAWVMTFDPWTETWTRYADMPHGRWYPTLTELPDGRVLIVGGWDESGGVDDGGDDRPPLMINNQDVEVFDPSAPPGSQATTVVSKLPPNGPGHPQPWPDHTNIGLYPHMFVLPASTKLGAGGDKVLVAGPGVYDSAVIDTTTWRWTDVVTPDPDDPDAPDTGRPRLSQDRSWGTAWLEPGGVDGSDRVVLLGGADSSDTAPGAGTAPPPVGTAEVLDLDEPEKGWQLGAAPSLVTGRAHFNTVLLPDGGIFTNGGGYGRKDDTLYADPVYGAELLRPGATAWEEVGSEADARTYHSVSVLLPDGSVASAGDDRDIPGAISPDHIAVENRTAQIWSPPYLFAGPRPVVTSAPKEVAYGSTFRVTVDGDPTRISQAVLVRPASVTHAVEMAARVVRLDVARDGTGLTLTAPRDGTVAPPGYHMLFLVDDEGVPSVATWVRVDATVANPQPVPVLPPTPDPGATPAPAVSPAPRPAAAPFRVRTLSAAAAGRGRTVRVTVRLRTSRAARARITLVRGRRAVAARTVRLRAGVLARPRIAVPRARLKGARRLRVRVLITHGGRRTTSVTTVRVPRAR